MVRNGDDKIVRLTDTRFRRLERLIGAVEQEQRGTNTRLDQAVDVLTRLVGVVAAQNDRMNRNFDRLNGRFDRLTDAIVKGRTADSRRLTHLERRVDGIEERLDR